MGYIKSRSTLPANRRVDLNTEIRQGSNRRYEREISEAVLGTLDIDENLDARVKAVLAGDAVGESNNFVNYAKGIVRVVTFSCTNGSVAATVDGMGIQSGAYVEHGKTVVFTITPNLNYKYTGTNPESVIVTSDVTKSYVCESSEYAYERTNLTFIGTSEGEVYVCDAGNLFPATGTINVHLKGVDSEGVTHEFSGDMEADGENVYHVTTGEDVNWYIERINSSYKIYYYPTE